MWKQGFLEKRSLGGEIAFVGRENVKNIHKLLLFGGEISSSKGPEKNTMWKDYRQACKSSFIMHTIKCIGVGTRGAPGACAPPSFQSVPYMFCTTK